MLLIDFTCGNRKLQIIKR